MKLHIGCGPCYIDGFYNVDIRKDVKTDFCGSLFDADIKPKSAKLIWSCHMLEHLDYPRGVIDCLELFHKWLKPGGILRLSLPDLELIANYYINGDTRLFTMYAGTTDSTYYKKDSAAERFMHFARGWEHTILFDFPLIESLLRDTGFKSICQCQPGESRVGKWVHDRYQLESMYVECIK